MLSKMLQPFKGGTQDDHYRLLEHDGRGRRQPPDRGLAAHNYQQARHATADFTEADDEDDDSNEDGDDEDADSGANVLPLFSTSQLDSLPVYSITHAIRIIVQSRTETSLTWDQLRSPQVSQFLIKPMQQQIRAQHFSRASLYALMANCLQFAKECQLYPGNAGTSSTRAKVCELLAIKLLKEYTTRELIDALSYDFYPLQGMPGLQTPLAPAKTRSAALRTSTLEVAIRAFAKHFLAHPLVVQQLEAIWNGAISFHSAADQLHRDCALPSSGPATPSWRRHDARTPLLAVQQAKNGHVRFQLPPPGRRTVMLYNPRNASLFKLSRLRVPRYGQVLSTCSLAVLICLFLAVLIRRSARITTLELVFWFWSAGFMLDELVGFTEQGFELYIMSFWNIVDLGILMLLIAYYCMRLWGVFLIDAHKWNDRAYDILAANAILLLPRIFSVLDHYQYFSQLLIAFRLMAVDLAAVLVLVLISCSGFFVFFTLSRSPTNNDAGLVAYKIFQILMGFTPAAWEVWNDYDWLGRLLMGFFLVICHFVVVTILITVLTNSFMSIASNAKEEHQFLFAINTISMVKNDTLFSYVAPGNIFAWLLMPLRYCLPLRQFVWLNRLIIKITHFPLLFCIYVYERFMLAQSMYEPTDLVENQARSRGRSLSFAFADPANRSALFSPNIRVREEPMVGYQKDCALEEVFRRAPDSAVTRTRRRNERRRTQKAIRSWMDQNDNHCSPNQFSTIDSRAGLGWPRRLSLSRERPSRRRNLSEVRSAASDPADLLSNAALATGSGSPPAIFARPERAADRKASPDHTEADGDDELMTNDEDEEDNATNTMEARSHQTGPAKREDFFATPVAAPFATELDSAGPWTAGPPTHSPSPRAGQARRGTLHNRTLSTNTILYAPQDGRRPRSASSASLDKAYNSRSRPLSTRHMPVEIPAAMAHVPPARRSPRRSVYLASARPRLSMPPRDMARTAPNRILTIDIPARKGPPRRRTSVEFDASSDLNAAMAADAQFGAIPSSFATQMAHALATGGLATPGLMGSRNKAVAAAEESDANRMSRLMLAKMKTLEEVLGDVVHEMRVIRSAVPSTAHNSGDDGSVSKGRPRTARKRKGGAGSAASGSSSGLAGPAVIEVERPVARRLDASRSKNAKSAKSMRRDKEKGKKNLQSAGPASPVMAPVSSLADVAGDEDDAHQKREASMDPDLTPRGSSY